MDGVGVYEAAILMEVATMVFDTEPADHEKTGLSDLQGAR